MYQISEELRFWSLVVILENGCWQWVGSIPKSLKHGTGGYGKFRLQNGYRIAAHRYAYEYCIGPIPEGLEPDHTCRNRACVNPWHMEPVPHKVNVFRGIANPCTQNAMKLFCKHGHPLSGDNVMTRKGGGRRCRICKNADGRKSYWKNK